MDIKTYVSLILQLLNLFLIFSMYRRIPSNQIQYHYVQLLFCCKIANFKFIPTQWHNTFIQ
jgi:hypothetical protein